jgi:hypothetical protein
VAVLADGSEMPFSLFLGVPVHRVPAVVAESGMCTDGWIPVDPLTTETQYPAGNVALSVQVILDWLDSIGRRDGQHGLGS